jgi:hypothetical protein
VSQDLDDIRRFRDDVPEPDSRSWGIGLAALTRAIDADGRATPPRHVAAGPNRRSPLRIVRRWPPLAVAALAFATAATAAAAIVALTDRSSAPLTGTVPSLSPLHYDVSVIPDLEAGHAGWCSFPSFTISDVPPPDSGGGPCAPAYDPRAPIVLAGGEPISNAADLFAASHTRLTTAQGNTTLFYAIVTAPVAAVRLRPGYVVASRNDMRLATGWKAVIAFVSGPINPQALDRQGHVIPRLPAGTHFISQRSPTRAYAPSSAAASPCSIRAPHLPNVSASWQVVATRVPTLGSTVGANVLYSCAQGWYSTRGTTRATSASLLLSARQPSQDAPPLPGLQPTTQRGVFLEDGGAGGPILAKRTGRAWLVVQGPSLDADTTLLQALRAEGAAIGS